MEEWKEYKLGEVLKLKYGKDHKKLSDGNIPVYGSGGLMRKVDTAIYKGPSILIPRKGSLNNVFYVESDFWTVDTMFWSIVNTNLVDSKFLYYSICKKDLASLNVGSAVPSLTIPVLENIDLKIPSIQIQRKIASILSSIDDKIELNRRINANLEEQAQALFKSWFIEFEPFKDGKFVDSELGMIPEGWKVEKLTDIADYLNGLAMQKFPPSNENESLPVLKIKELGQKRCDINSDRCSNLIDEKYIITDGDIIFSWSGTLLVDLWCGGKCGLNQHLFKVTPKKEFNKWFAYYWTKFHLDKFIRIAKDKAVTMGHIKRGDLDSSKVLIPPKDVLKVIDKVFCPIVDSILTTRLESVRLSALRDTLLPKLMSGEIEIKD